MPEGPYKQKKRPSAQKKRASASAKARYKSFCGDGGLGEGELFTKSSPELLLKQSSLRKLCAAYGVKAAGRKGTEFSRLRRGKAATCS